MCSFRQLAGRRSFPLLCPGLSACVGALSLVTTPCAFAQALPEAPTPTHPAPPSQGDGQRCRVSGQVMSADGAVIAGAHVRLSSQSASAAVQTFTTDTSGHFSFSELAPGPYTLTISLPGFSLDTESLELHAGESLSLPPAKLTLAVVSFSVDAITPEQAALEQLHAEEHQRLVGILPNFFVSYNWVAPPLTAGQKFRLATHNVLDPGNLALVGVVAGIQQADNAFPGYSQGAAGYGRRYGADLGNLVAGTYMGGAVLPALFHQDPRYFYKGTGTVRSRVKYALSRAVITRGDNGKDQPNFAGVLGDLSAGALSNLYYPASDRQGAKLFLENGLLGIAGDAMNDVVQEFLLPRFTTKGKKDKKPSKNTP